MPSGQITDKKIKGVHLKLFPSHAGAFMVRLAAFFVLLLLAFYLFQDKLLHHPTRYTVPFLVQFCGETRLQVWPAVEDYRGILSSETATPVRGTVIVFHGGDGSAIDRTYYSDQFRTLQYQVLLLEYTGYGARTGGLTEEEITGDAASTVEMIYRKFGPPIYLFAESLGAGIAAAVAAKQGKIIDGIVLVTPWDNLPNVAQSQYWFLPARWIVRDTYDSIKNLDRFPGPLGIVVAEKDSSVPLEASMNLFNSFKGRKRLWITANAGHYDWIDHVNVAWWSEAMGYLSNKR